MNTNAAPPSTPQGQPLVANTQEALLAEMRDLHEPEPVGAWPPAPGWWLVTLILLGLLVFLYVKAVRHNRKRAYRREALHQLMLAREGYRTSGDGSRYAQDILEIIKRTALTAYPSDSQRIAGLHGNAWLNFLDSTCPICKFDSEEGRGLVAAAYSSAADPSVLQHCHVQARLWIAGHRTQGGLLSA